MGCDEEFSFRGKIAKVLDVGANIWVIGDVHGHFKTLKHLVEKLNLNKHDIIILLGDIIDRGQHPLMLSDM